MNRLYDLRDADGCLQMLAGDLVWITPEDMHHFLSEGAVLRFLRRQIAEEAQPRYVDIASIKSSPSADNIMTVAYEVNLVSREDEKPLHLRCSMAICRRSKRLEITFLHFSKRAERDSTEQLRDFVTNLPCGVMILACLDGQREEAIFYNEYFAHRLRYRQEEFARAMEKNPFFMASEEDRERIRDEIARARGNGGSIAANLRFYRRDGNSFYYRMIGAPAYQADGGTVFYCVFQETTGYKLATDRLKARHESTSEILRQVPEGICGIEYPGETEGKGKKAHGREPRVFFVSKNIPSMFGVSNSAFTKNILLDPCFGLEMTSITRKKLLDAKIFDASAVSVGSSGPVSCGIFRLKNPDGKPGAGRTPEESMPSGGRSPKEPMPSGGRNPEQMADRVELVVRRVCAKDRTVRLYLFYYDREAQLREMEAHVDRAMKMGRAGQEQLRAELRRAKESADRQRSEQNAALKEAWEKHEKQLSQAEDRLREEKNRTVLLTRQLEESRRVQKRMAGELEEEKWDAARRIHNCEAQAQQKILRAEEEIRSREEAAAKREEETIERFRDGEARLEQMAEESEQAVRKAEAARTLLEEQLREAQERARILEQRLQNERARRQLLEEQWKNGGSLPIAHGTAAVQDPEGSVERSGASSRISDQYPLREKVFSPEDCLREVLDFGKQACEAKGLSLRSYRDSRLPAAVTGFEDLLSRALRELLENVIGHARTGGTISVHSRADRPSGGFVTLYFRIDDDGEAIPRGGMQGIFDDGEAIPRGGMKTIFDDGGLLDVEPAEGAGGGRRYAIFAAREAATLMGGSIHASGGLEGTRLTLTVTLRIAEKTPE